MRLTTFTDYSLRVLIYLAAKSRPRATIGEIAASFDISQSHFMEGELVAAECFGTSESSIARVCCLRGILAEAVDAFHSVLDRYTLADLVADDSAL
jgi:Rrf2 family transcriptional regulator, nitric oxide-sensitive transcriptional repressor